MRSRVVVVRRRVVTVYCDCAVTTVVEGGRVVVDRGGRLVGVVDEVELRGGRDVVDLGKRVVLECSPTVVELLEKRTRRT